MDRDYNRIVRHQLKTLKQEKKELRLRRNFTQSKSELVDLNESLSKPLLPLIKENSRYDSLDNSYEDLFDNFSSIMIVEEDNKLKKNNLLAHV